MAMDLDEPDYGFHIFNESRPIPFDSIGNEMERLRQVVLHEDPQDVAAFGVFPLTTRGWEDLKQIKDNDPSMTAVKLSWNGFFQYVSDEDKVSAYKRVGMFLGENTHLEELDLSECGLDLDNSEKIRALFLGLNKNQSIRSLSLNDNRLEAAGIQIICPFVVNNPRLEKLDVSETTEFQLSLIPNSNYQCQADEVARLIARAIRNRKRKKLPPIKSLNLWSNGVTKKGVGYLSRALAKYNPELKELNLDDNKVDHSFCTALRFLRKQHCLIEKLSLSSYVGSLPNECLITLARSLKRNKHLGTLSLDQEDGNEEGFSDVAIGAVLDLVCDSSDINATFNSNHTLFSLGSEFLSSLDERCFPGSIHEKLKEYLVMNENADKKDVARRKIMKCHFKGDFDLTLVDVILGKQTSILADILSWFTKGASPVPSIPVMASCGCGHTRFCPFGCTFPLSRSVVPSFRGTNGATAVVCPLFARFGFCLLANCELDHSGAGEGRSVYDGPKLNAVFKILTRNVSSLCEFFQSENMEPMMKKQKTI